MNERRRQHQGSHLRKAASAVRLRRTVRLSRTVRLPRASGALGAVAAVVLTGMPAAQADEAQARVSAPADAGWEQVGTDLKSGISGLAVSREPGADGTLRALIVRDNKRPGDNRVAELSYRPGSLTSPAAASSPAAAASPRTAPRAAAATVRPLRWTGSAQPVDLEAVEAVPGSPGEYVAVASRGIVYHVKVSGGTADVLDVSPLPAIGQGDDFESFTLTTLAGRTAAVWADRGAGTGRPATLYAATFSFDAYGAASFGAVTKTPFRATYPSGGVRHASDLGVTGSGRLLVGSASDAGDDGPFDSAVSDAGRVAVDGAGRVRVVRDGSSGLLRRFPGHKIEAVECLPSGTAVLGTDDENAGGAVTTAPLCGG